MRFYILFIGVLFSVNAMASFVSPNVFYESPVTVRKLGSTSVSSEQGSMEIAQTYRREQRQVETMLQFDMNAYNAAGVDKIWASE